MILLFCMSFTYNCMLKANDITITSLITSNCINDKVVIVISVNIPKMTNVILNNNLVNNLINIDTNVIKLETLIKLSQNRIDEIYGGLPTYYAGPSSDASKKTLDILIAKWKERDLAVSNLNNLKQELNKLINNK